MQRLILFTAASLLLIFSARADYRSIATINGKPVYMPARAIEGEKRQAQIEAAINEELVLQWCEATGLKIRQEEFSKPLQSIADQHFGGSMEKMKEAAVKGGITYEDFLRINYRHWLFPNIRVSVGDILMTQEERRQRWADFLKRLHDEARIEMNPETAKGGAK